MNFTQLTAFLTVARTGHFTRAAAQLHLAQPSISRQIALLEQHLGEALFHRARGNVMLTEAGERLLPHAKRIIADAARARDEMADLSGLKCGHIRIGATPTLCTSLIVEVLAVFHERYPGIDIEIMERGSRTLIEALVAGELDLAAIVTSVSSGAARAVLERETLLSERLVAVSAAALPSPFDTTKPLELRQLARVPQIMFPENYDLRTAVDAAFNAADLTPLVVVTGTEMDAALRFAERGIGVAIVPALVALDRPALRTHRLRADSLVRTVSIARRNDMVLTRAVAALQEVIREVTATLTIAGGKLGDFVMRM